MPYPVTVPRQLDWNEIERLRQARSLLTAGTKCEREDYYLEQQQLVDVKLWLEEHMEDYPQWIIAPGTGFTRQFSRDATAEEIAEAEAVVLELAPFETARRITTFGDRLDAMAATPVPRNTGETVQWRRPVPVAVNTSSEPQPLTTTTGTVSSSSTNTIPSGGFWWVDEVGDVGTSAMVVGPTPTMLMYTDIETTAVPVAR
jgi:hypothetical protein